MNKVTYDSQFSRVFHSFELNEVKFQILLDKATTLRDFKNEISQKVNNDLPKYTRMSKFDFLKHFNCQISGVSGQDIQHAIVNVYTAYENRFNQINTKVTFRTVKTWKTIFYKRNTPNHNKGDLKEIKITLNPASDLQSCLKFLIRFNDGDDVLSFVKDKLSVNEFSSDGHKEFYKMVEEKLLKFGQSRLLDLAISKRDKFTKRYPNPIEFTSLSFNSINRGKTVILNYNKNFGSKINAFINLGTFGEKRGTRLEIPVKYSKNHHGDIKLFQKGHNTSYTICLNEKTRAVRIILSYAGEREVFIDGDSPVGVDVNVKHNMFSCSNGDTIDYDREMIREYAKFQRRIDLKNQRKKKMKQSPGLSKKDQVTYNNWKVRINDMLERKVVELIQTAKASGFNHIVLEDLESMGRSFVKMNDFEGFKYSRFMHLLGIPALKSRVRSICAKHGVQCTFVHPHYTSQQCPECGYISRENRACQEEFKCCKCGHGDNADHNAAINILRRVSIDVLCSKLLKQTRVQELVPRRLKKEKIFEVLESYDYQAEKLKTACGNVTTCYSFR
jgi:IS605 OrfB family transposase